MNKPLPYLLSFLFAAISIAAFGQTPVSPLQGLEGRTIRTTEFGLLYDQYNETTEMQNVYHFIGRYRAATPNTVDTSDYTTRTTYNQVTARDRNMDMKSGDINGDGFDDYVSVVQDTNNRPYVRYTLIDTLAIKADYTSGFEINIPIATVPDGQNRLYLAVGDFDGTETKDFVVSYIDSASKELRLRWYWLNGSTTATMRSSIRVPKDSTMVPLTLGYDINAFHMSTADFDNDGDDELAVIYTVSGQSNQNIITYPYIAIFEMEGGQFIFKGNKLLGAQNGYNNCTVAGGNFSGTGKDDLAFALGYAWGNGNVWAGAAKVDLAQDAANVISNVNMSTQHNSISNLGGLTNLAVGDLNGDGTDEMVIINDYGICYSVNYPAMTLVQKGFQLFVSGMYFSNCGFQAGDVDRDGTEELISPVLDRSSTEETFTILITQVNSNLLTGTQKARKDFMTWYNVYEDWSTFPPTDVQYPPRRYVLAGGDYNGNEFTVGPGTHYFKPEIVQPLVILNAPPVHFDMLGGDTFDVTKCYNGNACNFASTYFKGLTTTLDVSTELSQDWGVDAKLSAGGNFGVVDVGGYMSASYGEKFSNVSGSSNTYSISEEISAVEDDQIYALVVNYDIWEYPVSRKGRPIGNMIALKPTLTERKWFPSKSWSAFSYIPNHEVGNIMSYKNYSNLDNPDSDVKIKGSYATVGSGVTLGAGGTFTWELKWNDVSSNTSVQQRDIGVEVGANVGAYGISLEANASYSQSQVQTVTTTLDQNLFLKAQLASGLDMTIGQVRYTVTPYSYWGKNGALVLDYAVEPELQILGGTPTWWYDNYNIQDPAFIMPWRYDPEKGFALGATEAIKRRQTKSVMMYPQVANVGDTVKLRAIVHNFGLQTTSGNIELKFYMGDPVYQRVITDINGNSTFNIPQMGEREREILEIQWVVPAGIYRYPRIYASIDPANTITELHRNNNIGWNVFSVPDGSTVDPDSVTSVSDLTERVSLVECFPNPFGNHIRMSYETLEAGMAKITVCDVTGKVVATVLNRQETAGLHSMSYDASSLSAGVYFFNFSLPGYSETKRLVKMGQ